MSDGPEQVTLQPAFGSAKARISHWWHHGKIVQTTIGLVLTGVILFILAGLIGTACALALQGRAEEIGPFLQATQPYVLPTLGAAVGYAFGQRAATPPSPGGDT